MEQLQLHGFNSYLLDGITGSGKTEIYLQAIEQCLRYGRQALVLIPEISLTPQTERRFRERFNCNLVTLHSRLSDTQRLQAWSEARSGQASIVLGTRSAVFTPLATVGLIVVDEEHDQSYKQQEGFRYSARDIAVMRAREEAVPIILGSATPALESLHNVRRGNYQHLILSDRAGPATPPSWQLVDLRNHTTQAGIAPPTHHAIKQQLEAGHQVLVFLNRRGYAPTLLCHHCGWSAECRHCDARMTLHRQQRKLACHHCESRLRIPRQCPNCNSDQLLAVGEGTERSEEWLQQQFPDTAVLRVDRDSTRRVGAMKQLYETVDSGAPCILVGTQMLAKGHHFANISLVVIIDADSGLFSADFRSHERFAQLLTQVAGRSGRGQIPGTVIIQTHQPQHPVLNTLMEQGYGPLAQQLLDQRHSCDLPPCQHMAVVRAASSRPQNAEQFLRQARQYAQQLQPPSPQLSYIGPLPANMERRNGRYRYLLQIVADNRSALHRLLSNLALQLESLPDAKRVRWSIDVDPQEM